MTLTDAGPLIALIDADEADHQMCLDALDQVTLPLVTTWPAFTEAMYLLGQAGGIAGQLALWQLVDTSRLVLSDLSESARRRSERLMQQYSDVPMDLADATLVALAEEINQRSIFTLDSDFHIYRFKGRGYLSLVPSA